MERGAPDIVLGVQKKFVGQKQKKYGLPSVIHSANNCFAECQKMTLGKSPLCRVSAEDTRQRVNGGGPLPSVRRITLGKASFAECYCLPSARHSTNHLFAECQLFAECFISGTR